ncbi:hypothetical protein Glove_283g32 [Diversispora epigaea]|uniref:Cytochrome P450 n=1 Tax=Diversispora epigaea TaxID=1348612 RepID=A0A397I1H1_9GLOM|nr:hypothetical protein Glove_283g32 [Diversispora epigaea]
MISFMENYNSFNLFNIVDILIIGLLTYVLIFYIQYFTRNKRLPGPIPIPIIGNIEAYRVDFMKTAEKMQLKYGDFWEIWQGSDRHVWISRADLATKLLNPSFHNNNYSFRTAENKGLELMGLTSKGIIYNLNLEGWITDRKYINQIFMSPKFLRQSVQITSELFSEMEKYWINLGLGIELNLANWMMRFMTDFTFIATTNKKIYALLNYYNTFPNSKNDDDDGDGDDEVINNSTAILQESEKMVKAIRTHFMAAIFFKDTAKYLRILYPPYRAKSKKLLSEVGWLNERVKELVEERKKEIEEIYKDNTNTLSEKELRADMLTMMLTLNISHDTTTTTKDAEPMSEDEIQEIVYEIIGGGIDTTSNSFCYLIYYIEHYPEVKEKMMKEIELLFGKDINRPITYEELNKSSYCDSIIKEVSRLMTTVPVLFRINSKADEIDGHKFEPSTIFKINVKEIQMNKAHWKDPEKFNPDRFMGSNAESIQRNSFLPFGGGSRICPGKQLAMLQMKQLMMLFYRKYDVELVDKNAPIKYVSSVVNHCEELMFRIKLK